MACLPSPNDPYDFITERWGTHTHTHTWASYCVVSLICHVEEVTQTCMTHKHKQTVTNANMPHFTHVRANDHKHTVSPPRPTHAYLYNLSQQAFLLLKPVEPQTYWNWLHYFVLHILYNIMLMSFAFFLTHHNISFGVLEDVKVRKKNLASMNPLDGGVGLCWPSFLLGWRWNLFSLALSAATQDKASETKQGHVLWFAIICIYY